MKIFSFAPIADTSAEVLILGTMPGERSLAISQYYGHGGNHFWKILFELHDKPNSKDYAQRTCLLIESRIALWDVLKACEREGSADSAILQEEANDFAAFFTYHPRIRLIAFNGKNAAVFFQKHVSTVIPLPHVILPSTSSANGWLSYEQKVAEWRKALNVR